jgi:hypothetical protein
MTEHDCKQGSEQWFALRSEVPTASCFDRILTPVELEPSAAAFGYLCEKIDEWDVGGPLTEATAQWMGRGHEFEDQARAWYELEHFTEVRQVGFVTNGIAGCSPDGLVGDDGMIEIKVLMMLNHTRYWLSDWYTALEQAFAPLRTKKRRGEPRPPSIAQDHRLQIQGGLWICERQWCDAISFHPTSKRTGKSLPAVVERMERDETVIDKLAAAVAAFNTQLHAALVEHGYREPE